MLTFADGFCCINQVHYAYQHTRITETEVDLTFQNTEGDLYEMIEATRQAYYAMERVEVTVGEIPQGAMIVKVGAIIVPVNEYYTITLRALNE